MDQNIDYEVVRSNVSFLRELYGLTRQELAARMDISLSYVSSVENGSFKPDEKSLSRFAIGLNVSIDRLIDENFRQQAYDFLDLKPIK